MHPSDDEAFWTHFLGRAKARRGLNNLPEAERDGGELDEPEREVESADGEEDLDGKKPLWVVVVKVRLIDSCGLHSRSFA